MSKPKIPGWNMTISKARQRWADVRDAATSGDPAKMFDAVSKFEPIAEAAFAEWYRKAQITPMPPTADEISTRD